MTGSGAGGSARSPAWQKPLLPMARAVPLGLRSPRASVLFEEQSSASPGAREGETAGTEAGLGCGRTKRGPGTPSFSSSTK